MRVSALTSTLPVPYPQSSSKPSSLSRSDRLMRGWIVAIAANALAAASHGLAGGGLPHPILWLLCTALSALLCVGLAGRRLSRLNMATSVVASQGLLHFFFMNSGGSAHVSAEHLHHVAVGSAPTAMIHQHSTLSWQMVLFHLLAATITYALLRRGEVLSEKLVSAFVREVRIWTSGVVLPFIPQAKRMSWARSFGFSLTQRVLVDVRSVRGPPIVIAQ